MMKLVIVLIISLLCSTVYAQQGGSQHIIYKGQHGFFFPDVVGTKVLKDLALYHDQVTELKLLNEKLELSDREASLLRQRVDLSVLEVKSYQRSYKLEHELRVADRTFYAKQHSGFFKNPGVMFALGFVVASLCAIGLSFGLYHSQTRYER